MGWVGVALQLVGGAVSAYSSAKAGQEAKKEAEYNASWIDKTMPVYDAQMALVEKNKQLVSYQAGRAISQAMGTSTAMTAGKGLGMSGSPMAIMLDTQTQMEISKRINESNSDMEKYNIGVEKSRAQSQAEAYRRGGSSALFQGYANAFTTALQTGAKYGENTGAFTTKNVTVTQKAGKI